MRSEAATSRGRKDLYSWSVGLIALAALLWILGDLMG